MTKGRFLSSLKAKYQSNKCFRFSIILALILIIAEIFVFNFNSFILLFGNYEQQELKFSDASFQNFTFEDEKSATLSESGSAIISFTDINRPIHTLTVNLSLNDKMSTTTATVNMSDSTHADLRYWAARITFINGDERSQTIPCQFSGSVKDLQIVFDLSDDQSVTITNVIVNKPIPLRFSFLRIIIIFFLFTIPYRFVNSEKLKRTFSQDRTRAFRTTVIITQVCICVALLCAGLYRTDSDGTFWSDFTSTEGNQITKELVDAFEKGQIQLIEKPSQEILNIENPYDWSQRNNANASYLWDHCLYNGNYYSYYGIAPVILLFLPYHLLTGFYFPTTWAVLLFSIIGIIYLSKLYYIIVKKWFPNLPLNYMIMGLILLQTASGIWVNISRAAFYEIAISSGFAFLLIGVYLLIRSNIIGDGKLSRVRLAFSTTFLSLAVLSRPTLAVYCVASLAIIYLGLKKARTVEVKKGLKTVTYLLAALIPFIIIGGVQIAYNYLRFDSPFDFGIKYSLTINDFVNAQFHPQFVSMYLYAFLFATPYFSPDFPFFHSSFQTFNVNGYFFTDDRYIDGIAIGLFFRALPMFALFLWRKAYKKVEKHTARKALVIIGSFCVIAPLTILISVWESGYAIRYNADFSWQMLLGTLIIIFTLVLNSKNEAMKKLATRLVSVSAVFCILINFAQLYSFIIDRYVSDQVSAWFYSFERLFEFWR